jgi:hypothetical protein
MFRTVFPSIIRRSRLYTQHQVYVIQVSWLLAKGHEIELMSSISCPLASSQLTIITYTWCCVYSFELVMTDGKFSETCRVLFSRLENCVSSWFYYRNISRCTVLWTSKIDKCV